MNRYKHLIILAVLATFLMLPAVVKADPIILTLDSSQNAAQGASATFMGSLTNGGMPARFINAVSFTLNYSGPGTITFDSSAFFANVPSMLNPGQTTGLVAFFDAIASSLVTPGTYTGSFSVLGGDDANANTLLATQDFMIVIMNGTEPVPEPATLLLLGSGLAGAAAAVRRRRMARGETRAAPVE